MSRPAHSAYLVGFHDRETFALLGAGIHSDAPWEESRNMPRVHELVALSAVGDSFDEARKRVLQFAVRSRRDLAPWIALLPEEDRRYAEVERRRFAAVVEEAGRQLQEAKRARP